MKAKKYILKVLLIIGIITIGFWSFTVNILASTGQDALNRIDGVGKSWVYGVSRSFLDSHTKSGFSAVNGNSYSTNWLCYCHQYELRFIGWESIPTCTSGGWMYVGCNQNSPGNYSADTIGVVSGAVSHGKVWIPAFGHASNGVTKTKSATCTTAGYTYTNCTYCNAEIVQSTISATGHTSANGGTSGVHTKCSICGTTISSTHSYTSSITKSATCTTAGTRKYTCTCGYSYTESISATGHTYNTSWTYVDNNGITNGARYHKCNNCSAYTDLQYGCWVGGDNGINAVSGQNWYNAGSSVTLTATVKNGYTWSKWTWTGSGSSTNQTFTFTINNAYQFVANSTANTYSITLDENDGNELSDITYTVETETFNLPTPTRTGYNFIGWTGSNGTTPQTTVSIAKGTTGNKSYTANWELKKFNINTNCSNGGIISNNCEEIYYGDTTSIFIMPMDGYEITNVIVDGKSVGIVDTYDFWDIESDHTVIATFKRTDGLDQYLEVLANKYYWIDLEF